MNRGESWNVISEFQLREGRISNSLQTIRNLKKGHHKLSSVDRVETLYKTCKIGSIDFFF